MTLFIINKKVFWLRQVKKLFCDTAGILWHCWNFTDMCHFLLNLIQYIVICLKKCMDGKAADPKDTA